MTIDPASKQIHVVVVDSDSSNLEAIEPQFVDDFAIDITVVLYDYDAVEIITEQQPDCIVWMYDPDEIITFDIIGQLTRRLPTVAVLLLADNADEMLLKQAMLAGARSVMTFPVDPDMLYKEIIRIYTQFQPEMQAGIVIDSPEFSADDNLHSADSEATHPLHVVGDDTAQLAPLNDTDNSDSADIIAVYSTGSGAGTTVIATNLAIGLAQQGQRTLLIDCDLPFGDISVLLNLRSTPSMSNLINRYDLAADMSKFNEVIHEVSSGLHVLLPPSRLRLSLKLLIDYPDLINEIIYHVEQEYDTIVLDLSHTMNSMTANLLQMANRVLFITLPTLIATNNTRRVLGLFASSGINADKISLILNKHVENPDVDLAYLSQERIDRFLKTQSIQATIPRIDEGHIMQSVTKAEPLITAPDEHSAPFVDAVQAIIHQLIDVST